MQPQKGQPSQQSIKIQMKQGMKGLKDASKIPDDMGLLPGTNFGITSQMLQRAQLTLATDTFIMPTGKNLPSLFREPRFRFQIEWRRVKRRFQDYLSAFIAFKTQIYSSIPRGKRPARPKINLFTIKPAAIKLHKQMYTAYANGDAKALEDICADNVRDHYQSRIENRNEKGELMKWELVSYKGRPKLCSMKAGGTPIELKGIPVGIQQAVVRIRSLQKLTIGNKTGARASRQKGKDKENVIWKEPNEKEVTEYIVIQRRLLEGKFEPWKVWGFVKEMDVVAERKKNGEILEQQDKILARGISTPR